MEWTYRLNRVNIFIFYFLLVTTSVFAQDPVDTYRQNCASCHTIGGGNLTGPDLKNVTQRKDRAWLSAFITNPRSKIDSGDPYALDLVSAFRGVIMPTLPGMTKERVEALLNLIDAESKLEKSQFVGSQLSDRPFTARDIDFGHRIFLGEITLIKGGPSCISCHSVNGLGGFGGGALAPDLTSVFERYQGRTALSMWLTNPATPTMQSVYKNRSIEPEEVLALTAYFQNTLSRSPEDPSKSQLNFFLIGLAGAVVVLGFFDVVWNKRFRAVRRPLVEKMKWENKQ